MHCAKIFHADETIRIYNLMDMLLVQDFSGEWFAKNKDDRFVDVHEFKKPILFQNNLFQKTNINSANFNLLLVSNKIVIGCVI